MKKSTSIIALSIFLTTSIYAESTWADTIQAAHDKMQRKEAKEEINNNCARRETLLIPRKERKKRTLLPSEIKRNKK